jgi:hypothetical protein
MQLRELVSEFGIIAIEVHGAAAMPQGHNVKWPRVRFQTLCWWKSTTPPARWTAGRNVDIWCLCRVLEISLAESQSCGVKKVIWMLEGYSRNI